MKVARKGGLITRGQCTREAERVRGYRCEGGVRGRGGGQDREGIKMKRRR